MTRLVMKSAIVMLPDNTSPEAIQEIDMCHTSAPACFDVNATLQCPAA